MFMFLFLFFSMLLLCSFFRLKELFQVKNGLTTSLLFLFLKMPKIWVGRTTLNGEKRENGLSQPDSVKINFISIGNSMICSNIWHKYHE